MKAKLAYLCGSQSWGGLEMNHVKNALWMLERGHAVCFICVKGSPCDKYAWELGVPTHHILPHKKYYDFKKASLLADFLLKNVFTHLLIRSNADMSIAASVKRKLKNAIHTSYFMEMQLGVNKKHLLHTIRYKYIDLWSCPLPWLEKQVRTMTNFKNDLVTIPSGIDRSQFNNLPSQEEARRMLELPADAFVFGLIGRFDPQKGQLLLLEAMRKCRNNNFCVAFLGEPTMYEGDTYYKEMLRIVNDEDLSQRVFIRPFMSEVGIFYRAVNWIIMATKAETFGMVTIEALASGTPVLGSNAGGTSEILTGFGMQGGLLFESMNADSLAEQIDFIIDNKVLLDSNQLVQMTNMYDHKTVCEQVEVALAIRNNQ